jgi:hypothetical protein
MSDLPPPPHPSPDGPPPTWGQPTGGPPSGDPPTGGPPPEHGRSRRPLIVGLVVVLVVAAGGAAYLLTQGGDGGDDLPPLPELSATEREYVDVIAEPLRTEDGVDEDRAECVGAAIVKVVGVDTLQDAVTPEELRDSPTGDLRVFGVEVGEDRVRDLARRYDQCLDLTEHVFGSAEGAPPQLVRCIQDHLTEEDLAYYAAADAVGSQDLLDDTDAQFEEAIDACEEGEGGEGG